MQTRVALGLLVIAALAHSAAAQLPKQLPPVVVTDTLANSVTVQNNRDAAITVYLRAGNFDRRLGMVESHDVKTLPLPEWAVAGQTKVSLVVHPENEPRDLATETLTLRPPGRVGMIVLAGGISQAGAARDTMMEFIAPEELANATLTVDNPRDVPVTVFAAARLFDVRLGEVPPKSRVTLRFPKSVVSPFGSIQVFVHPQNGRDLGTETFKVGAGDHLGLRVPPGN